MPIQMKAGAMKRRATSQGSGALLPPFGMAAGENGKQTPGYPSSFIGGFPNAVPCPPDMGAGVPPILGVRDFFERKSELPVFNPSRDDVLRHSSFRSSDHRS